MKTKCIIFLMPGRYSNAFLYIHVGGTQPSDRNYRTNFLQLPYGRTRITLFLPPLFLHHGLISCTEVWPFSISRLLWRETVSPHQTSTVEVRHFHFNINRMHFRLERSGKWIPQHLFWCCIYSAVTFKI